MVNFLDGDPIPYIGLVPIDPRSRSNILITIDISRRRPVQILMRCYSVNFRMTMKTKYMGTRKYEKLYIICNIVVSQLNFKEPKKVKRIIASRGCIFFGAE